MSGEQARAHERALEQAVVDAIAGMVPQRHNVEFFMRVATNAELLAAVERLRHVRRLANEVKSVFLV